MMGSRVRVTQAAPAFPPDCNGIGVASTLRKGSAEKKEQTRYFMRLRTAPPKLTNILTFRVRWEEFAAQLWTGHADSLLAVTLKPDGRRCKSAPIRFFFDTAICYE